jgi:GTP pyrophosphokinase
LALRIATKNIDDCYVVLWVIHKIFKIKNDRFKDYISSPKENWYQSIHTTVYDNNSNILEIQIQTFEMSKLNKSGLAAHFIYKWFWVEYINMPTWMKWVLDIQKKSIDTKCFLEKLNNEIIVSDIKCLSQDGKMILLPKNSVLIDFAYEIWDDYWNNFESATINWMPTNDPFFELNDWDFIKIKKWTSVNFDYKVEKIVLVKTQKARDKLKEMFNKYSKTKTEDLWKFLLNNELELYSYNHFEHLPQKIKQSVIKNFWLKDEKQFFLFLWLEILEQKKVFDYIITF